ncbi:hypothetical protein B0H15DRAFT_957245 [Mycena belliarum]|uniref:Uncharacterized protein n=1 Tax=Mycena belliarum TaxID=1033014 RepID=A0AAD6XLS2_9AGAR|nr:hypothetical protein B0H15DRAFT_957245 [Mycena belliae]
MHAPLLLAVFFFFRFSLQAPFFREEQMLSLAFVLLSAAFANGAAALVARGSIVCPAENNDNMPLNQKYSTGDRLFCTYSGDGEPCSYFSDGGLDHGSDKCPSDISQPVAWNFNTSLVLCAAFNAKLDVKSTIGQLSSSLNVSASVVECTYSDGSECYYNLGDGSTNHGTGTCPHSIGSTVYGSDYVCTSANFQSALIGSSLVVSASESILACVFEDKTLCKYSWADGSRIPGAGSMCPQYVTKSMVYSGQAPWMDYSAKCLPTLSHAPATAGALSDDDSILTCDYTSVSVVCEYQFSSGHLVGGGSDCPPLLNETAYGPPIGAGAAAAGSSVASSSSSSSPSSSSASSSSSSSSLSPGQYICAALNNNLTVSQYGNALEDVLWIGDGLVCNYHDDTSCYYSQKDGNHINDWTQICPPAVHKVFVGSFTNCAELHADTIKTSGEYTCLTETLNASILIGADVISVSDSLQVCLYDDATTCLYSMQGSLNPQSGGSCPKSVASWTKPQSSSNTSTYSSSESQNYGSSSPWGNGCLAFNEHITASSTLGSQLKASLNISESVVKCTYSDNNDCYYNRKNGNHSTSYSAGQYCPDSIAQSTESSYVCVSANLNASVLLGSSVIISETEPLSIVACVFEDQTSCLYDTHMGTLHTGGGSWCPKSTTESPDHQPGYGTGPAAAGAGKGLLAESGSTDNKSSSGIMISKPVLIALLALNGFLVIAVLAIGCFIVFRSPSVGNPRLKPLNAGSGYKTVDSLSVPLTHGDDTYYDPPTKH